MIEIEIRRVADRASMLAAEVATTATMQKKNYTGLSEVDRYLYGYLGEMAVEAAMIDSGVVHTYHPTADGLPDRGDFVVRYGRSELSLDVKTASKEYHRRLMMPEKQFRRHHRDLYVAARVTSETVEIHGFVTRKKAEMLPVGDFGRGVRTVFIDLLALRPIEELFELLDKVKR